MFDFFQKKQKLDPDLKAGDRHYRAFIGPPDKYDLVSAMQFNLLTKYGLREKHKLLDIGCGSLRGGRLFIIYLLENKYYGVEPEKWLVDDGIYHELGNQIIKQKKPKFLYTESFDFAAFNTRFDFALAQSIFTHASASQIHTCLKNLSYVSNDNFKFLASFIEGDENYEGDEWVYPRCVTYQFEYLNDIANTYGFVCHKLDEHHPNNHTWLLIEKKT